MLGTRLGAFRKCSGVRIRTPIEQPVKRVDATNVGTAAIPVTPGAFHEHHQRAVSIDADAEHSRPTDRPGGIEAP